MKNKDISVVTCTMDRHEHLKEHVLSTARLDNLREHIIVDYSSKKSIPQEIYDLNSKVKIVKVNYENEWWLSRAFNFAFQLAKGNFILKLDADTILRSDEINKIDLTNLDGTVFAYGGGKGNFLIKREIINKVNGFNEYIFNWGAEDNDLISRISKSINVNVLIQDSKKFIEVNDHSDEIRYQYKVKNYRALSVAFSKANRYIMSNSHWETGKMLYYEKLDENNYKINHFYTFRDKNLFIKLKYKSVFLENYFDKLFSTNKFTKYKLFDFFFVLFPLQLVKTLLNVNLYPEKTKL